MTTARANDAPQRSGAAKRAFVALGANVGPRRATLEWALRALDASEGVRVVARSSWHRTAPVGGPVGQPAFLNGAAELETSRTPHDLLALMLELEVRTGRLRTRATQDGPRSLDLDLLLFADHIVDDARLELPHPRLEERAFVLAPLAEIAPDLVLPRCGVRVRERLAALGVPHEPTPAAP
ncbi:2-amino-4-hydroxy-6-hydroxymethyldihydropteridine pyrophosphokinase [Planctomycetes bacterium Pla163]|uniref:2-amino-4-hydroxy-6-hydroxymethyldihydropteridine pyrophosphokinase n=1 Tax=Rohdeia mirabilis TaxID=2528008 RepID=A0A518CZI7_9BACT|nr:2-amino-4-hydroxy-6-hydroxymethyldihydropteridine pyrophosphokinase [Planctomycetes bacterium Pla163]